MFPKKRWLVYLVLLAIPSSLWADAPPQLWSQRFGDATAQQASSLAIDASGNVVLSGQFEGSIDLGGGVFASSGWRDIFLAKFDAGGNHLWSHSFGGVDYDHAPSVVVDGFGNIVMVGYFRGGTLNLGGDTFTAQEGDWDLFFAKFSPHGNHLWSHSFPYDDSQLTFAVAVDPEDNIIWTGHFYQTINFGGGVLTSTSSYDMYLAKFDSNGNHIWSKSYGRTGSELSSNLAIDASGNAIVAGLFDGTVDFGGGILTTAGDDDVYLVKVDSDGDHMWSQSFGDANFQRVDGLAVDPSENVVLTGSYLGAVNFGGGDLTSEGGYDIFLAKYDAEGAHLWSDRFGDANTQHTHDAAVDASGNVVITGSFSGTVDFGGGALANNSPPFPDVFLAKLDADGNHVWSDRFGDTDLDVAETIVLDGWDNVVLSGRFRSVIDFGGDMLTSAGGDDVFLVKFASAATAIVGRPTAGVELHAFPNPFNPSTVVLYSLPTSGFAKLQIFDVGGRLIQTVFEGKHPSGEHRMTWDGRDQGGSRVASGVYFVRLSFEGEDRTRKIVLLK